jgi:arsenic resistance protein ArsH
LHSPDNGGGGPTSQDLAISETQDDPAVRVKYRPFLLDPEVAAHDWVSALELDTVTSMVQEDLKKTDSRLKILVLYGSLRRRSVFKLDLGLTGRD